MGEGDDGSGTSLVWVCMCVCAGRGGGWKGVQGVHEASLPYQRHARLSVLMVITLPTIGTLCLDHNNKKKVKKRKKMDGEMTRRGIKGKRRGVQLAGAFRLC